MKKPKERKYRIVVALRPDLEADVKRAAADKRWSINTFIEEAIIEKLAAQDTK